MQEVTLDLEVSSDSAMVWRDDRLYLLDQRQLPEREVFIECTDVRVTAEAIRAHGFYEYFDPTDGTPCGGADFTWTAAIWLTWAGRED